MALIKSSPQGTTPPEAPAPQDFATLLTELEALQPSKRRAAAHGLAAYPEAAMALCERLEIEASPSVRAVLFATLIRLQSPAVAMQLTALLRSDDTALRNAAIEALQEMPEAFAAHLPELLADADSDVRIFAVNILALLRHPRAPEWLVGVIRSDPHINVCAAALDGLAEIGTPEMQDDLEELRRRFAGNAFMAFAIDTALRRIREE